VGKCAIEYSIQSVDTKRSGSQHRCEHCDSVDATSERTISFNLKRRAAANAIKILVNGLMQCARINTQVHRLIKCIHSNIKPLHMALTADVCAPLAGTKSRDGLMNSIFHYSINIHALFRQTSASRPIEFLCSCSILHLYREPLKHNYFFFQDHCCNSEISFDRTDILFHGSH
jgi:hypothetical protein